MEKNKEAIVTTTMIGKYGDGYVTENIETLIDWVVNTKQSATMQITSSEFGIFNVFFHYDMEHSCGKYCLDNSSEFHIEISFDIVPLENNLNKKCSDYIEIDNKENTLNTLDDAVKWLKSTLLEYNSFLGMLNN